MNFFSYVLLSLLISFSANAEMASLFGVGPQSSAMGGVSLIEDSPNAFQAYSAPAALGFIRKVELSAGGQYMKTSLRPFGTLVLNSNGTLGEFKSTGIKDGGGNLLAFAFPLGQVHPVTVAGNFYLPYGTLIRISGAPVNYPFYPLYSDISSNFFFVIGVGYEFAEGWAVGINLRSTTKSTALYSLRSDNSINYSASAVEAKSQTRISLSFLYDHGKKNPEAAWSIGAMYRAPSSMETKLTADVSAFVPVQGSLASVPFYTPGEYAVMASKRFGEKLVLSADLSRVLWSQYISPYGSGNINTYVIGSAYRQAGFYDIWVPKVGAEFREKLKGKVLKMLKLRFGYQYHPTPVPDQKDDTNFVDNNRHLFSTGAGFNLDHPWKQDDSIDVDGFFEWNVLSRRETHKNFATNVGAPGYATGGSIWVAGGAVTLKF